MRTSTGLGGQAKLLLGPTRTLFAARVDLDDIPIRLAPDDGEHETHLILGHPQILGGQANGLIVVSAVPDHPRHPIDRNRASIASATDSKSN
jgi:hypothetical protein